jgi:protease-4
MSDSSTLRPIPPPPSMSPSTSRRSRWWIPVAIIGGFLVLVVGGIAAFIMALASGFSSGSSQVTVDDESVLVIDLSRGVSEAEVTAPFDFGGARSATSLRDVVQAINNAAKDDRIKGILYKAEGAVGMAKSTEIREAMVAFAKSGKFSYSYIVGGTKGHYYLASATDSIFMPSEGMLEFNAFGAQGTFFKDMFEKIGVEWHVQQFEEYKSAGEMFSRTGWSQPAKDEVRAIIEQRRSMFLDAVSTSRKLERNAVAAHLDSGIYTAHQALDAGLVDDLVMEDEMRERIKQRIGGERASDSTKRLRTISLSSYISAGYDGDKRTLDKENGIAIVYASGAITSGSADESPFADDEGIKSRTLVRHLRRAADNKRVKGIILRIDSPGGSVIASEEIWAAILDIKKRTGKPIYASMSDVAASGGYYIAMGCDTIIAHPSTITGSIGVILMLPNLTGTMGKLGITSDTITTGASFGFLNPMMPLTNANKAKLYNLSQPIYQRFVQKVADSRGKDYDEARALAKGRVYTGTAALEAGLIDVEGGLQASIDLMKKRLGVAEGSRTRVFIYPEKQDPMQIILKLFGIDQSDEASAPTTDVLAALIQKSAGASTPWREVYQTLPAPVQQQLRHTAAVTALARTEHTLAVLPGLIHIE